MPASADQLDTLPNRLVLNGTLKQAIDARGSIAVALLDIDSFMEINTDFGQAVGDRVLRVLAALLKEAAPGSVYHLSGDEFAIVLRCGFSSRVSFPRRAASSSSNRFASKCSE